MLHPPPLSPTSTQSVSGCPSLRRIVSATDGGICRVRLMGGTLNVEQAKIIASASKRFGNGVIELTNRANLQIRGVRAEHEADLIAALLQAGLGEASDHADAASNVLLSPLAGLCPHAVLDVRPLAQALLEQLRWINGAGEADPVHPQSGKAAPYGDTVTTQPRMGQLSPKFSVQLDGGESLTMLGHHHDLWFAALPRDNRPAQDAWFAFGMAGSPPTFAEQPAALGAVHIGLMPALTSAFLATFLALRKDGESRIRHLVQRLGNAAILEYAFRELAAATAHKQAGSSAAPSLALRESYDAQVSPAVDAALHGRLRLPDAALKAWRRNSANPATRFGMGEQTAGPSPALWYVGGQAPLGRLHADALSRIAMLAAALQQHHPDGVNSASDLHTLFAQGLKITPWQGVLLPNLKHADLRDAQAGLRDAGLIVSARHPLGALVACTGRSGCAKGHADTKADAHALAQVLDHAVPVHLSACERSCAAAHPMPFTLLAQPSGAYDLYTSLDDPHDHPAQTRFGRRIALNLTIQQAAAHLNLLTNTAIASSNSPASSPPDSIHSSLASSTDTSQKSHA